MLYTLSLKIAHLLVRISLKIIVCVSDFSFRKASVFVCTCVSVDLAVFFSIWYYLPFISIFQTRMLFEARYVTCVLKKFIVFVPSRRSQCLYFSPITSCKHVLAYDLPPDRTMDRSPPFFFYSFTIKIIQTLLLCWTNSFQGGSGHVTFCGYPFCPWELHLFFPHQIHAVL